MKLRYVTGLVLFLAYVVSTLSGCGLLSMEAQNRKIEDRKQVIAELDKQIKELQSVMTHVDKVRSQNAELEKQIRELRPQVEELRARAGAKKEAPKLAPFR